MDVQDWVSLAVLCFLCFLCSAALTRSVRGYSIRNAILDVPNERSSHSRATPRGGGVAIAAASLSGIGAAGLGGWIDSSLMLALSGGGGLVALVGWLDDRGHIPAPIRMGAHFAAAGWALWMLGGLPDVRLGEAEIAVGWTGTLAAAVGIVWLTNLYNFMDGIDGIAAGEAVSVGSVAGTLLLIMGHGGMAAVAWVIAAAAGGFLVWNWAPAKIFMGDVGSGLLGFLFGTVAIASEGAGAVPLLVWVLLLGTFVMDATATLLRRVVRGERWYSAHCKHAYQRIARAGFSHARVTSGVLLLNAGLGGAALVAVLVPGSLIPVFLAAFTGLGGVYLAVERLHPMETDTSMPLAAAANDESSGAVPKTGSF